MTPQPNHPAANAAEIRDAISDPDVEGLWEWGEGLAALPLILELREEMNRVRESELTAAYKRLPALTPGQRETLERLSQALMNEFLDEPTVRLCSAAANSRGLGIVEVARYLFGLDDGRAITGSAHAGDVRAA
jgi:glutamyl-tRNA reductase